MTASAPGRSGSSFTYGAHGASEGLSPLRESLDVWLAAGGVEPATRWAVVLAVHEAVANALEHGAGGADVTARLGSRRVFVATLGGGAWKARLDASDDDGGRGFAIIDALADSWDLHHEPGITWLTMSFLLEPAHGGGPRP